MGVAFVAEVIFAITVSLASLMPSLTPVMVIVPEVDPAEILIDAALFV